MDIKEMKFELSKSMNAIAEERDKIDDLISEAMNLRDNCDRVYEDLEHARNALSELV